LTGPSPSVRGIATAWIRFRTETEGEVMLSDE
jgi:hypothetical protein